MTADAALVVEQLRKKHLKISFAESCTGGLMSKLITDIPHASEVFECGFVAYSDRIKREVLGLSAQTIAEHTVYSSCTAEEMAKKCAEISGADIGVGITGVAGPGTDNGTCAGSVWYSIYTAEGGRLRTDKLSLSGSRESIREQTAAIILHALDELLRAQPHIII